MRPDFFQIIKCVATLNISHRIKLHLKSLKITRLKTLVNIDLFMVIILKPILCPVDQMEAFPNPLDSFMYLYRNTKQKVVLKGI